MSVATAEKLENEQENTQAKVKWEDRSPAEQREMIKANIAYQINHAVENGTSVLFDKHTKEDFLKEENIAYSGFNGKSYSGINALMLDNMKNERGYKRNAWLNANEAMRMGAFLGQGLNKLKGLPFVEIHTIQTEITKAVRDENGEIMRGSDGKAITETTKLPRPQLNSHRVYNVEEIARISGFKINMVKPLDNARDAKGRFGFMASAHNEKGEIDPNKAIVLDELKNVKIKVKVKDEKGIEKEVEKKP